jgi:hypothetical protein
VTCEPIRGGVVCRPRERVVTHTHREAWCFGCRRRGPHTLVLIGTEDLWYDPMPAWVCDRCGEDRTTFPGG